MSNKLILNNGDIINISEFSSLNNIIINCKISEVLGLFSKLTKSNLTHIQFKNETDDILGEYYDMKLEPGTYKIIDENIEVSLSIREKVELEKKVDEMEYNQKLHGDAIKELQEKIITS